MTDRILSFQMCNDLQKIGFCGPTTSFYQTDQYFFRVSDLRTESDFNTKVVPCPTISQTLEFIWNSFSTNVEVFVNDNRTFGFIISNIKEDGSRVETGGGMYDSRSQAELEAIETFLYYQTL